MTLGERIKLVRTQKLRVEQGTLAAMIGVSAVAVSKWERDETVITPDNLERLAKVTDVRIEWYTTKNLIDVMSQRDRMAFWLFAMLSEDDQTFFRDNVDSFIEHFLERWSKAWRDQHDAEIH
jgi:transcriptional regulator with XRE-family HTH domain